MKHSILLLLFIALFLNTTAQEIGLQFYSLRNEFKKDVPGTLALIKKMGIREVEGGDTYGLPLEDFKKLLTENGLKVVSVGADFQALADDPMSVVKNANAFGAKYAVCFWIPHQGDDFTIEDTKRAVDVFTRAGKVLSENGITLCYHPHGFEFRSYENGTLFDYLVRNTDAKHLNFEMDVFWVKQAGQDPVAILKKYPKRFLLLHLKDRRHGTPDSNNGRADVETNVVLGTGDVGIAAIMKQAKQMGIKHYFIEDESSRVVEQIPQSLAYLKKLK